MNVDEFLGLLENVKPTQRGWSGRCPAHEDRSPSLSIAEGDDGRVLVRCFGGCPTDKVCAALGLRLADLFPGDRDRYANSWTPTTPEERQAAENRRLRRQILTVELQERRTMRALAHATNVLAVCLQEDAEIVLDRVWKVALAELDREAAAEAEQAA